jgi:hypothetical protein
MLEEVMSMNELQMVNLEQTDITTWNFAELKEELSRALSVYETTAYTDETIKMAKDDKAKLAKAKKVVEDQRKAYKSKCLAPYEALEPQIKEIVGMIEEQRSAVDGVIKDFTERQKTEKKEKIHRYYQNKSFVLEDLAEPLFEKLFDPKWLNATASKAKVEEGIQVAINNALNDINDIKAMKSPFEKTLLETYVATLSVEDVKAKHQELEMATEKAGLSQQLVEAAPAVDTAPIESTPVSAVSQSDVHAEDGVVLNIFAKKNQLDQLFDFMKAIGVRYDVK